MFDTVLLKTFVAVVDEAGFSRAAERLHLTQSAVSGHLRRLEEQVGKPLLKRTTRSLELSADGARLIGYARAILALNRDAAAQMAGADYHGRARVGIAEDFADTGVLRALHAFADEYPGIEVEVQVGIPGDLLRQMKQGALDIVVGSQCGGPERGRLLWREPLVWARAAHASVTLPSPLPLALFPEPCPYREAALASLARCGMAQRTVMVCNSIASLRAAALSGFAVAPLAASRLGEGLVALKAEQGLPPLPDVEFMLFVAEGGDRAMLAALAERIVDSCRPLGAINLQ
ncbi:MULTISPECIES: LysR family transcriptional regulator [unclassified Janthinobacterium]|uniref:LysR family transcriptional regulator n=1 Tax=unclassified Janthinobacterium TaxID=2610881 RepID=UPI0004769DB9|nr:MULTISPECIES: LysR family transcriptional regulator [unclassified Janthinobacterium]MEC5160509.1 DNA-binding transcriptional LysR family regulator [Janthinobacterium sp. CG_S6]